MVVSLSGKAVGWQGAGLGQSTSVWVHVALSVSMSMTSVSQAHPQTFEPPR